MKSRVTISDTTSVTKMTGFFASARGSSLRRASIDALAMILLSNRPWGLAFEAMSISDQKVLPPSIRKCSTIGASDSAGKYCRR